MKTVFILLMVTFATVFLETILQGQVSEFNGLYMNLGNLPRLSHAETRSISPENFTGEKGRGGMATEGTGSRAARELGQNTETKQYQEFTTPFAGMPQVIRPDGHNVSQQRFSLFVPVARHGSHPVRKRLESHDSSSGLAIRGKVSSSSR